MLAVIFIAEAKVSLFKTTPMKNVLLISHLQILTNPTMFNFIIHPNIHFIAHILTLLLSGIREMQFCRELTNQPTKPSVIKLSVIFNFADVPSFSELIFFVSFRFTLVYFPF